MLWGIWYWHLQHTLSCSSQLTGFMGKVSAMHEAAQMTLTEQNIMGHWAAHSKLILFKHLHPFPYSPAHHPCIHACV